jgi:CubicO group peptidase (beta-lactamase class C family)
MTFADTLQATLRWSVPTVATAVLRHGTLVAGIGAAGHVFRLASISKPMTALATLIACEEGVVSLNDPVGQRGCTLRHLLAHAGGYPFDGDAPIALPERKRIYSNTGIELAATHVAAAADMPFANYLADAVFAPLGMATTELRGSPANQVHSTLADTVRFVAELMRPTLIAAETAEAMRSIHFPTLSGVVPGVGSFARNSWGLGVEVKGDKTAHWMGGLSSAATFGHFGGSGTMTWIDPATDVAVVALTDRRIALSDAVIQAATEP